VGDQGGRGGREGSGGGSSGEQGGGHERREIYIREDRAGAGRGSPFPDQRYILTRTGPDRARDPCRPALGAAGGRLDGRARARRGGRAPGGGFWTHPDFWTHPNLASWRWARGPAAFLCPPAPSSASSASSAGRPSRPPRRQTGGGKGDGEAGVLAGVGSGWEGRSREMGRILTKSVRCTLWDQNGGPLCMGKKSCTDHLHS
jgi:hypothetical protein